jgi:cysteine desulfurase
MRRWFQKKRIYLDYAATAPIEGRVFSVMNKIYKNKYFNPGGLYREGVFAASELSQCRKSVAQLIGTISDHVVFTRGGTESNNMAVLGVLTPQSKPLPAGFAVHPLLKEERVLPHVIVSAIEHAAVLECVKDLEKSGIISLSLAPVDERGIIDMKELKKLLRPETALVSVMYVNNEIGTIQPIKEIAKLIRWHKKNRPSSLSSLAPFFLASSEKEGVARRREDYPLFHTDAIQAANYLDINVERLGVDLMSLSGSKIYGPKSSGVLYVRNRELIGSLFHGGDQEFGLRAGTEDLAQVAGFTKALEIARKDSDAESVRLSALRDFMMGELTKNIPGVIVNGANPLHDSGEGGSRREPGEVLRIANNINISVPGISGERLVIELDAKGISVASKSACKEDSGEASHVLTALRTPQSLAEPRDSSPYQGEHPNSIDGAVRFTLGRRTQKGDIQRVVSELVKIINRIKAFENDLKKV